jgi:MFS family permease
MVGPILGPTLGGYLTEALSWRWTFFINLPVGIFSAMLVWRTVAHTELKQRDMDWLGLLTMGIGGLQFLLDRGNQDDWFEAISIQYATLVSIVGFLGFLWHSLTKHEHVIFDPAIFRDRNFTTASLLLAVFGLGLGLGLFATLTTNHTQVAWHNLDHNLSPFNPALKDYLQGLHLSSNSPEAPYLLARELSHQASMLGMLDAFTLVTWSFALMLPLVFVMRYRHPQTPPLPEK